MKRTETVLLVEDQAIVRQSLKQAIVQAFGSDVQIHEAATFKQAEAVIMCEADSLSLAVLDISLPDGSGLDLLPLLNAEAVNCLALMCTIFDDDESLFSALKNGAKGYLLKDHSQEELAQQLRQSRLGSPPLSPRIAHRILGHFAQAPAAAPPADVVEAELTKREKQVLMQLAQGKTRRQVADALCISTHTVADHIKHIYRKLNISSRAEAARAAVQLGLTEP